jgi:hypothetical protein
MRVQISYRASPKITGLSRVGENRLLKILVVTVGASILEYDFSRPDANCIGVLEEVPL